MGTKNSNYKASFNNELLPCVSGPGNGLGYYSHTLYPELTCKSDTEAVRAALIANIAYEAGYRRAQSNIKLALEEFPSKPEETSG